MYMYMYMHTLIIKSRLSSHIHNDRSFKIVIKFAIFFGNHVLWWGTGVLYMY